MTNDTTNAEFNSGFNTTLDRVTCVHTDSASTLDEALNAAEYDIVTLRGESIGDTASLFGQIGRDLPGDTDPPTHNWDALADWIWQFMAARGSNRIALVWRDAHVLLNSSLPALFKTVQIVSDVSREAEAGEGGFPFPVRIVLCLVGDGDGFPPFTG